jgi:sugar O-acyltransferase (sialic acid O-acetyltransferase NeuD family)
MTKGEKIVVYGAGGMGREVLQTVRGIFREDSGSVLGFVDDGVEPGVMRNGAPVLGDIDFLLAAKEPISVVLGIANPSIKKKIFQRLKENELLSFPNIIHPKADISEYSSLGEAVVISAGCVVSLDARLEDCVFLNFGVIIGHDAKVGPFTSIMSMAIISGCVEIGEGCMIGTGALIRQDIKIGSGCMASMGSVVLRDVPDGSSVMGNPARRIS